MKAKRGSKRTKIIYHYLPQIQTIITHRQRHRTRFHPTIQPHTQCITLIHVCPIRTICTTLEGCHEIDTPGCIIVYPLGYTSIDSRFASSGDAARVVVGYYCDVSTFFEGVEGQFVVIIIIGGGSGMTNVMQSRGSRCIDGVAGAEVGGV